METRRRWIVPVGPGAAFHRLARTPLHRWWRPLVGTAFVVAAGFVALLAVVVGAMAVAALTEGGSPTKMRREGIFGNATADLGVQLLSLAVLTPVVLLAAWLVQRRPTGSLSSVTGGLRGRWLLTCAWLAVVACLASRVVTWETFALTDAQESPAMAWVGWAAYLPAAMVIVLLVPLQAAAEEYVFRGWLLQAIAACTLETCTGRVGRAASVVFRTPWPAIVISALVFTAAHGYRNWALLDVFLFAIVAGWLAVRTGGLEAPIAMHMLNNLVVFMVPAATGTLGEALRITDAPWQGIVGTVAQLAVFTALVLAAFRRRRLDTVTPRPV